MSAALLQAAAQASAQESSASPVGGDDEQNYSDGEGDHEGDHDNDIAAEETTTVGSAEKRKKRPRACHACRGMKIRCLPVEGQEACKACSKVGRACVMPGPARKRQKTVHKVAELEKKIDALTKSLAAKNAATGESGEDPSYLERQSNGVRQDSRNRFVTVPTPPSESPGSMSNLSTQARQFLSASARFDQEFDTQKLPERVTTQNHAHPNYKTSELALNGETSSSEYIDVITRGILTIETAMEIFERWKVEMCPSGPFVAFPDHVTIHWMRQKKPMVLLAILGVASGTIQPDLQTDLMVELARQLSDRVMYYCEKSVDLAQALLISPLWYGKHRDAKDLGFNHYIHSAVTMCLNLGLGKRSRKAVEITAEEDLERRRLWLGCYYMAGNVTTLLRLPSLVKFSPYINECLECFATHPSALPTDHWLCSLVRLMHIYEDVGILFHMDDPGSVIPLNDSRTQYHLKMFEKQLEDWKKAAENGFVPKPILDQFVAVTSLYIHEIAMHSDHNVDDFTPASMKDLTLLSPPAQRDFMTNEHFEALSICVDSMESALLAFESIDLRILRGLPCLHMVWIAYTSVAMIRLHGLLSAPDSRYGYIFLPKMHVQRHLDSCVARLTFIVGEYSHSPAEAFLVAFKKLRAWFALRTSETNAGNNSNESSTYPINEQGKRNDGNGLNELPYSPSSSNNASSRHHSTSLSSGQHRQNQSSPKQSLSSFPAINQPSSQSLLPHQTMMSNQPRVANLLNHPPTGSMNPPTSGSLVDPGANIDASAFDIAWDLDGINMNLNELNNFDVYMNDVGWMGYLM